MNNIRRIALYAVVAILAVMLTNAWFKDYPPQRHQSSTSIQPTSLSNTSKDTADFSPTTYNPSGVAQAKKAGISHVAIHSLEASTKDLITVKTDVLQVTLDSRGGNIVAAKLPRYPVSLQQKDTPIQILSADPGALYTAQSGLTNTGSKGQAATIQFSTSKKSYVLQNGQNRLVVELQGRASNGLAVVKTYIFERNRYAIQLNYQAVNRSAKKWTGSLFTQITRTKPVAEGHHLYTRAYNGAAISSPTTPYEKITYKDMNEKNISRTIRGGWIAMQQHYFLTAWIPASPTRTYHYYSHVVTPTAEHDATYIIGFVNPQMTIAPGAKASSQATFYVGPEISGRLKPLATGLDHTIDYGWLWPVSVIIFWIMHGVFWLVGNWGWAIIITTILIKLVFYPLTAKSFRSMARMREMQPRMQALKERYGSDRQALSKATMELYRKEKINPVGGCLPMIIQIPVFIALYYVLIESVQLRQSPFIFWIDDLSVKDPHYVLPILMGISMLVQQWISPTSTDPTQQKMMWVLPIVFTIFFVNFPAGLVLYWLVNNVVQVLQQWYVNKTYEKHKAKKLIRKKNKKFLKRPR